MPVEFNWLVDKKQYELLSVLTHRVRVVSVPQIARTWPSIVSSLGRMQLQGIIHSFDALVHPELKLTGPVARWSKGEASPDFAAASYALRERWSEPAVNIKCIIASRATGHLFGGCGGRFPRESEETHDIHLAAVYLRFRSQCPELAKAWVHEEEIKRERKQKRGKLPDAIVGKTRVIEFGGAYKKQKLMAFHKFCETQGCDYEVW